MDHQTHETRGTRFTRRAFVRGLVLLGVTASAVSLSAACAPTSPQGASAPSTPTTPSASTGTGASTSVPAAAKPSAPNPAAKDSVTIGYWQELISLNALYTQSANSISAAKLAQRGLLFLDENSNWIGELAADVPSVANGGISSDGRAVTYKLRSGLTWHDGTPLTSADVRSTWQAIVDPASGVINRFGYDKIEGVDTPDDLTVVVRFSQPFASWPTLFDALIPKRVVDANPTGLANAADILQPIGAGPYRIVQYKTGELVEYAAFDGYWRGKPKIQRLFIKFYPSVEGLMQAVTAKEVDIGWNLTANLISQIQALAPQGIKLVDSGIPSSEKYLMNPDASKAPLFADKTLRQALQHAVDRQTIIDKILFGHTRLAHGDWDGSPWENTSLPAYAFDPDQSRQMLDSLGWTPRSDGIRQKDGIRLSFTGTTTAGNQQRENVQLLIQQYFKGVGVEMVIKNKQTAELFGTWQQKADAVLGNFEMLGFSQSLSKPDPEISVRYRASEIATDTKPGSQYYHYSNPDVEKLLDQAGAELDADKQKQLIFKAQEIIQDDAYFIYLYVLPQIYTAPAGLQNFTLNPFANYYWNPQDWSWA
jgi:peptide/nickel transport system substrate-binding protein